MPILAGNDHQLGLGLLEADQPEFLFGAALFDLIYIKTMVGFCCLAFFTVMPRQGWRSKASKRLRAWTCLGEEPAY